MVRATPLFCAFVVLAFACGNSAPPVTSESQIPATSESASAENPAPSVPESDTKTMSEPVPANSVPSPDEYIACGCGCGTDDASAMDVEECVPSRKALKKIAEDDAKSLTDPGCANMGASIGRRYRLCVGAK